MSEKLNDGVGFCHSFSEEKLSAEEYMKRYLVLRVDIDLNVRFHNSHFSVKLLETADAMKEVMKRGDDINIGLLERRLPDIRAVAVYGYNDIPYPLAHIPIALYLMGYDLDEIKKIDWGFGLLEE